MRQHSRVEPPTDLSQEQRLHPVLSNALASLDIQLEEELARYRRMRLNPQRSPQPRNRRTSTRPLDLISVAGGANMATESPVRTMPEVQYRQDMVAESSSYSTEAPENVVYQESSELAIAMPPSESPIENTPQIEGASLTEEQIHALVKPLHPQRLDDYLESSEELLRSLAQEEAAVQAERGFVQSLLTPLGAGSMLLLLLSSAMFGYLVMNPASVSRLLAFRGNDGASTVNGGASSQAPMAAPQPNLAAKEFKDLNLDTLGTLKPDAAKPVVPGAIASPSPAVPGQPKTVSPAPVAPATTSPTSPSGGTSTPLATRSEAPTTPRQAAPPVSTYEPPQPARSSVEPSRPARASAPASTSTYKPAPAKPPQVTVPSINSNQASSSSYPYKLVVPYANDRTLSDVQKVVPNAFLRNFSNGAKIQVEASQTQAEAEARAQELRKQGISAEVYKP